MARRKMTEEEKRITKELKRLDHIFGQVEDNKKNLAEGIIKRAAFMRIKLEDYELDLQTKGYVEMFSQSVNTEPYERERPVARLYNSMNKNYQSIMKQLFDLLSKDIIRDKDDGFDSFINGRDDV